MRESLRGWKPKLGVVTLLMACVLTSAWVRGLPKGKQLYFSLSKVNSIQVISLDGDLVIGTCEAADSSFSLLDQTLWTDLDVRRVGDFFPVEDTEVWNWKFGTFESLTHSTSLASIYYRFIPHWSIVLPLTLLSVNLLLSKPLVRTPVPENQPA
ncbi:hypothetical protein [Schlesneria paludicola]|uniref:hypothetical protein n=1 Tax=Schlesneria paludicola TaxID=360056 RepID=UPI00138B1002|nr:hypothetical protein [Schlesneria paludicola]